MRPFDVLAYGVGFTAQGLFGLRMISQWLQSERAGSVISPTTFWSSSLIASFLFLIYGILRRDEVIIFGQLLSYFIYIRNLQLKNVWRSLHPILRVVIISMPAITVAWLYSSSNIRGTLGEKDLFTNPLILQGAVGQLSLNFRFVYQWIHSERRKVSIFPIGFWIISIVGALCVLSYAVYRRDPVLLVAQLLGLGTYTRNLMIGLRKT